MKEYLAVLAPLFAAGQREAPGRGVPRAARLNVPGAEPLPILVAALAPKMLALTGGSRRRHDHLDDGPKTIREHTVPRIRSGGEGRPARAAHRRRPADRRVPATPRRRASGPRRTSGLRHACRPTARCSTARAPRARPTSRSSATRARSARSSIASRGGRDRLRRGRDPGGGGQRGAHAQSFCASLN